MSAPVNNSAVPPSRKKRGRLFATMSVIGFGLFIAVAIAFHFIQPGLNPGRRFISEYAAGRTGWLMNVAFFSLAGGLFSLAYGFSRGLDLPLKSRAGEILLILAAIGILGAGIFNTHLQDGEVTRSGILHTLSSFLAFLTLIPAMILYSGRLRKKTELQGTYRALPALSLLAAILFLAVLFVFGPVFQMAGLGQRLFLAALFAWLLLAAHGIRSEAFTPVGYGDR